MNENIAATKLCPSCNLIKSITDFSINKHRKIPAPHVKCKACKSKASQEWYKKNKIAERARRQELRKNGKENERRLELYHTSEAYRENQKRYSLKYKESKNGREKTNKRVAKYRENPSVKIKENLSNRIWQTVKKGLKTKKTIDMLGCSVECFLLHLESLWQPNMSWGNYGQRGWHIDHIIPCAAFDLSKPEEQLKCFHYTNLQPLWEGDNCRKKAWVADYQI